MAQLPHGLPRSQQVNGKVIALPYFADSQFLYYRKDLLEKYERPGAEDVGRDDATPRRRSWTARRTRNLQGFSTAGAPIEGTVCTYLVPLWGTGGDTQRRNGKLNLDGATAPGSRSSSRPHEAGGRAAQEHRRDRDRPHPRQTSRPATSSSRMNWGYVWNRVENDADTKVKGKIGVTPLPPTYGRQERRPASAAGSSRCRRSRRTRPRR